MRTLLLVQTERGRAREALAAAERIGQILRIHQADGAFDVVALVETSGTRVGDGSDIAASLRAIPGVLRVLECTLIEDRPLVGPHS
jgi:hypothetical protein